MSLQGGDDGTGNQSKMFHSRTDADGHDTSAESLVRMVPRPSTCLNFRSHSTSLGMFYHCVISQKAFECKCKCKCRFI